MDGEAVWRRPIADDALSLDLSKRLRDTLSPNTWSCAYGIVVSITGKSSYCDHSHWSLNSTKVKIRALVEVILIVTVNNMGFLDLGECIPEVVLHKH